MYVTLYIYIYIIFFMSINICYIVLSAIFEVVGNYNLWFLWKMTKKFQISGKILAEVYIDALNITQVI